MNRSIVPGPAAGIVAGVLLVAGSVLDWSGVSYSSTLDRRLAFAAGVVLVGVSAAALRWRPGVLVMAIPAGVLGLNMGVVNYRDISGKLYEYASYPDAAVGTGLYLVVAGGALGLFVGIVSVVTRSRGVRRRERGVSERE